jgi:hypothetical protein
VGNSGDIHLRNMRVKQKATNVESTVATKAEGVVFLPGRPSGSMIVAVTLAQTTVLSFQLYIST